ncbi:MAG: EamA family transporter [Hyphomicrobiales bacterium]|nr:MAG: EamA family transporter [Hyphomicrobiales bacterium]
MSARDWSLLVLLSIIWGGSFLFARIAVLEIPPLTLVFFRVFLAAIALNIYIVARRVPATTSRSIWWSFAMMGILNNIIPFSLIFYGQQEIGAGLAAIINAMTPIWTIMIAHQFTSDEKMTRVKVVGVLLGFAGVAVLIGPNIFSGLSNAGLAQIAVLGATISYALSGVFGRRFANINPVITARGQLTTSSLLMLPVAAYADQFWTLSLPSQSALWSVIALAIICTAFAYVLFFSILASAGAVNNALVTFLVPVSAVMMGIAVLGETLTQQHIIGTGLILIALLVIDGRLFSWSGK